MNPDRPDPPPEAPLAPPEPVGETRWLRWTVVVVALLALALFSWRGYAWLQAYVVQRHAIAESETPSLAAPLPRDDGASVPLAPVAPRSADEPFAPAVTGEAVHRCVRPDGQLVLTNQACPADSKPEAAPAVAAAPDRPRPGTISWAGDDPSLHEATCHYLTAEIARLGDEFQQPLPPPVIDLISTRLATLRRESEQGRCAPTAGGREGAATATTRPPARGKATSGKGAR